jgi:hypothetical protein
MEMVCRLRLLLACQINIHKVDMHNHLTTVLNITLQIWVLIPNGDNLVKVRGLLGFADTCSLL